MQKHSDMTEKEPLVSVIVPVYNSERYLKETFRSILEQSYRNIEVIAVDDGSTDGSAVVLKNMAAADPRLKVISTPNQGPSLARLTGVEAAAGEYVQFFDSDDLMLPGAIARSVEKAVATNADMVVCTFVTRFLSGEDVQSQEMRLPLMSGREYLADVLAGKGYWSLWNMIVKRSLFSTLEYLAKGLLMGEDSVWKAQILMACKRLARVEEPGMIYVERDDSLTHFKLLPDKKFADLIASEKWLLDYVSRNAEGSEFDVPLAIWKKNIMFQHIHYHRPDVVEEEMRELWRNIARYPEVEQSMNRHEKKVAEFFKRSTKVGLWRLKFKLWRKRMKARHRC